MGIGIGNREAIVPVDIKGVPLEKVPQFIQIQPRAAVAPGVNVQVTETIGVRDFVCSHIGFTTDPVGFPAAGQPFQVGIDDLGMSRTFQPRRWNITALTGTNPVTGDKPAVELPVPWVFEAHTTLRIEFENIGTMACTPSLLLIGYLDKMGR